jgi:large subunit ribosomal protein L5
MARARLLEEYRKTVIPKLKTKFSYKSVMQVPRISKITINMGLGEAMEDKKVIAAAMAELEKIAGQKPVATMSRKSIAGFKLREGWPIGCKVTLRGVRISR